MESITFVTAYFDLKIDGVRDRSDEEYKKYLKKLSQINYPIVIFCEEKNKDFIKGKNIHIITTEINELPYYDSIDKITEIQKNNLKKYKHNYKLVFNNPLYTIVINSKIKFIEKVVDLNPFNTNKFLWIDAAICRFIDLGNYRFNNLQNGIGFLDPGSVKFNDTDIVDKLNIHIYTPGIKKLFCRYQNIDLLIFSHSHHYVGGYLFGGNNKSIKSVSTKFDKIFYEMLENRMINTEEMIFSIIYKNNPELFNIYDKGLSKVSDVPFFNYLNS